MPKAVMHYFPKKGLAESVRILLAFGGQEFEDHRVTAEEWPSFKLSTPFGQLPVLEIDDKQYAQSAAISRYLGRKFGLGGKDLEEDFEIDQNVDFLNDIRIKATIAHNQDEAIRENKYQEFLTNECPFFLKKLDEIIMKNNGHFAAGRLTWADFVFAGSFEMLQLLFRMPDLGEKYPSFQQVVDAVYSDPKVKAYSDNAPKSEY